MTTKFILQCFDADELKRIKNELEPKMGMDLNLVQLIAYTDWNETQQKQPDGSWVNYNYDWMFKPGAMKQVAEYADGIGRDYHMLIEETSQPGNIKLTGMVQDAQQNKLVVHPYTVRSDKLPEYTTDVNQLYDALYNKAGVNGLFTDFPDKAVKFLNKVMLLQDGVHAPILSHIKFSIHHDLSPCTFVVKIVELPSTGFSLASNEISSIESWSERNGTHHLQCFSALTLVVRRCLIPVE